MTTTETSQFTVRRGGTFPAPSLPPFGQFIGGSFVASTSEETVDVVNPATEEVITRVPRFRLLHLRSPVKPTCAVPALSPPGPKPIDYSPR